MTIQQDSTHPTGVSDTSPRGTSEAARARLRKARSALQLRRDAYTWDQIAETLGYPTPRAAMVATERALEEEIRTSEGAEFMRHIAADRLDRILRGVWRKATDPDNPEHLQAVDRARQLIKDHADLKGYAAPKTSVVVNPTQSQIEKWVASVMKVDGPDLDEADIFEADIVSDTDDEQPAIEGP